jgi:hypothetical protein
MGQGCVLLLVALVRLLLLYCWIWQHSKVHGCTTNTTHKNRGGASFADALRDGSGNCRETCKLNLYDSLLGKAMHGFVPNYEPQPPEEAQATNSAHFERPNGLLDEQSNHGPVFRAVPLVIARSHSHDVGCVFLGVLLSEFANGDLLIR